MIKKFLGVISGVSVLLAGGTAVLAQQGSPAMPETAPQVCLQIDRVESWNIVNSRTMVVSDREGRKYRVGLDGDCAPSRFYDLVIFRPLDSSPIGCVRSGDRVRLSNRMGGIERCLVASVSPYSDAQMERDKNDERTRVR